MGRSAGRRRACGPVARGRGTGGGGRCGGGGDATGNGYASRRLITAKVTATSTAASATKMPASMNWKGQYLVAGW